MIIRPKTWLTFIGFCILSLSIWLVTTYPKFAFLNCSVTRSQALWSAEDYLRLVKKTDPDTYRKSVIFNVARVYDQYLQKALGFEKEVEFLTDHGLELFYWKVRFFRENEKEEFLFSVSAATGEIIAFQHLIKETDARPVQSQENAREQLFNVLKDRFNLDPEAFVLNTELTTKLDNRSDHSFSWEKKDVEVRWSDREDEGSAKLLTGGTVSGNDVLTFYKVSLKIPEPFNRYMEKMYTVGKNIALWFRILFYVLLTAAVFYVVVRRNDLVMHTTKNFALLMTLCLFLLLLAFQFNELESIIHRYPTTQSFSNYLYRQIMLFILDCFIVTLGFLMPCLAGGTLHDEVFREKREGAFLHYLNSSFRCRSVARFILLGYLSAGIMIGLQAGVFELGHRFLGVWSEHLWMTQLSSSYLPFVTAFVIGFNASLTEEVAFRFFSISLGKKIFRSTALAVLLSSVIWAFGHSGYQVFPMWFRGLEVTLLGIFLSFIYLRFGLITVLVTHYLFDVYWCCSAYIFGHSTPYLMSSALGILFLPLTLAVAFYLWNRPESVRPMKWVLSKHQLFNLEILRDYLRHHPELLKRGPRELAREIASHGWDIAVVEKALEIDPVD